MTIEEMKSLFLKLTEYTIPFKHENRLVKYLPAGYKKDSIGNYYYEIGKSETLFTTHLDTYCEKLEKVNHVIEGNIIKTDGTTILGGDNKLGCCILIAMIKNNIPGTYYFFIGEEPILSGGLYGSSEALEARPEFFAKFKRAVAFDRREYGSIVVRQKARMCCSMEFATAISEELNKHSAIDWDTKSNYGYYTDTAVFIDTIPECSNLSAGGFHEHHTNEYVDLNYTKKVLDAALKINWEALPTVRQVEIPDTIDAGIHKKYQSFKIENSLEKASNLFGFVDLLKSSDKIKNDGRYVVFSKWLEDYDLKLTVLDDGYILDGKKIKYQELVNYVIVNFRGEIINEVNSYIRMKDYKGLAAMLKLFDMKNFNQLKTLLEK
jgi:hypothetical protein